MCITCLKRVKHKVPLLGTDAILVSPEAIKYIEQVEKSEGTALSKFEIIEHFFEWLKQQPSPEQVSFLREALSE